MPIGWNEFRLRHLSKCLHGKGFFKDFVQSFDCSPVAFGTGISFLKKGRICLTSRGSRNWKAQFWKGGHRIQYSGSSECCVFPKPERSHRKGSIWLDETGFRNNCLPQLIPSLMGFLKEQLIAWKYLVLRVLHCDETRNLRNIETWQLFLFYNNCIEEYEIPIIQKIWIEYPSNGLKHSVH